MTRHYDSRAIWFLSIPGRFSKSSLTLQSDDTILLEGLKGSLCITGLFLPMGFLPELATALLLGSIGQCSLASLAWSNAAFLSQLPSLSSTNVRYHGLRLAIIPIIWFSHFVRVLVSCVLVYLLA
jgi:hypothetical protein